MALNKIPERKDIPQEYTWDLSDIFASDEDWLKEYESMRALPEKISVFAGHLGENAETLLNYFRLEDEIEIRLEKLISYASCKSDEDTALGFYQDLKSKATSVNVSIAGACAFSAPEIMAIPDETLEEFYKSCPELEEYRRALYRLRRRAAHILSPAEERLLAAAGEMSEAPELIGSALRNADMRFEDAIDSDGVRHPLSAGTFVPLLESPDRALRKSAFENCFNAYGQFKNTVAATLDGQFKQLRFYADARKYPSTLAAALDRTEVPESVYLNLIEAVHANMDKMYRYVSLRKKLLGVEELHMYDVYTPVVADAAVSISYEEAKEKILEALAVMGGDYVELLKKGFSERWIDVYENRGKRSGAYSSGCSRPHPYVLLNHKDTLDCMFTIAHEMGHALHSYHSTKYQPVSTADYVIFVAEVASTVNEVLLMRYLLNNTSDKKQRAYLINHFLDQFKGTVYRQTMFAEFELEMGRMSEAGQALTAEALCEKYLELNKLYFGPDMISDDGIALEWARIPHFFYNYYVFQYATGFSAAVAIAERILSEGECAVQDYKRFLSSGSSADPISLLKIAGVDMSSPEPVNSALSFFGELVEELEQL